VLAYVGSPEPRPRRHARLFALAFAVMVASGIRSNAHHFDGLAAADVERLPAVGSEGLSVVPAAAGDEVYYSRMTDEGYGLARAETGLVMDPPRGTDLLHPAIARDGSTGWVEVASRVSRIVRFPLPAAGVALTSLPVEIEDGEEPAISNDTKWLAFLRERPHGLGTLWIAERHADDEAAADTEVLLTDDGYDVLDLAFFPDDRIVMAARRESRPELFVLGPTRGAIVPLTTSDARVRYPAVSPDGRWLAYSAEERGAWQLRLMDLRTHEERHFPHRDCNAITPTWSGDGSTVVFASDCMRNVGNTALFRMRVSP
jgi:dipeptidyl aminopeptidase/acylaminoacyl peptidase